MNAPHARFAPGIGLDAPVGPEFAAVLTPAALSFVAFLQRGFRQRRHEILESRARRQAERDAGRAPDLLPETAHIRADDTWRVAACPADLADRKVELITPARRPALAEALRSGANTCLADIEDTIAPDWANIVEAQIALCEAAGAASAPRDATSHTAALLVRPRGWHLEESHMLVDGRPCAAAIFDFGLHFFHNAKVLIARGSAPYYCLPKLRSHLEARLWNDIFCLAQDELGVPRGSLRATVMIETLDAAFEMDEILYELREHCAGLKFGERDYLSSVIRTLHRRAGFCLAERIALEAPARFVRSCGLLLVKTCHHRGTHAIGATATDVPISASVAANDAAFAQASATMERDASQGFDGTSIVHPGMLAVARGAFERIIPGPNQIARQLDDIAVDIPAMLDFPLDPGLSEPGLRREIRIGVCWFAGWLGGAGHVTLDNRIEDTAGAELARALVWHWIRSPKGVLADGRKISREMVSMMVHAAADGAGATLQAANLFERLCLDDEFTTFVTVATGSRID
jgi:malate synthase